MRVSGTTNLVANGVQDADATSAYGRDTYWTGLVSGGAVTRDAGLVLNVAAGTGYVNDGTSPTLVTWNAGTVTLAASQADEYIYVTATGTVAHSNVPPSYWENIVLARAVTNATDVVVITQDEIDLGHILARLTNYMEHTIGPLVEEGAGVVAHATPLAITVVGGKFWVGLGERLVTGGAAVTFTGWYQDGGGGWTAVPGMTLVDDEFWDDGSGTLAAITGGKFTNHVLFIAVNGATEEYHVVYGQAEFAASLDAQSGDLPNAPEVLKEYCLRSAAIIVEKSAGAIDSIVDIRTQVGQHASTSGGVAGNHDLLINLEHDTHMHYLTAGRAATWHGGLAGSHVTNGDSHDHNGGDGAQIDHATLSNRGTLTHAQVETALTSHQGQIDAIVFGDDADHATALARTTTTSNTPQTKVSLTTAAGTGTYRVSWGAVVDAQIPNQSVYARLYNVTDATVVGVEQVNELPSMSARHMVGGLAYVVLSGVAKTLAVQWRNDNGTTTVGIQDATIEVWRVA